MRHPLTLTALAILLVFHPAFGQSAPSPALAGDVIGSGNFDHVVANLDKSFEFYRDVLGLESPAGAQPFGEKPEIMRLSNTIGGQNRIAVFRVPGSPLGVELIEYKGVDRQPAHPRFQDPGAATLILHVRDLDPLMARVKSSGTKVLTADNGPLSNRVDSRNVFIQDPDGFLVQLSQSIPAPEAAAGSGNVLGGEFETTVSDTEKTVKFYHDLLGFQLQAGDTFKSDRTTTAAVRIPGVKSRQTSGLVPGSALRVTFIEFRDVDRKPLHTRMQDPGTALLQLRVRDVDSLVKRLREAGTEVISAGGEPVTRGNLRLVILRDPNNLFLELFSPAGQGR